MLAALPEIAAASYEAATIIPAAETEASATGSQREKEEVAGPRNEAATATQVAAAEACFVEKTG